MINERTQFRPVYGTQDQILNTVAIPGYMYIASDTRKIWICDDNGSLKQIGGSGGSGGEGGSSNIFWTDGDEEENTLRKVTDNAEDGDPYFSMNISAIDGDNKYPEINALIINSDGRFFKVLDNTVDGEGFFDVKLIAVSGGGSGGSGGGGSSSERDTSMTYQGINPFGSNYIYGVDSKVTFKPVSDLYSAFNLVVKAINPTNDKVIKQWDFVNKPNKFDCVINMKDLPINTEGFKITTQLKFVGSSYNRNRGLELDFFPIKIFTMYIEKSSETTPAVQTGKIVLNFKPHYDGLWDEETEISPVKIYYAIDDIESDGIQHNKELTKNTNANPTTIEVTVKDYGIHTFYVWLKVNINGIEYMSDKIMYEIPYVNNLSTEPLLWIKEELGTIIQYEPAVLSFMIYDPAALEGDGISTVKLLQEGAEYDSRNYSYDPHVWNTIDFTSRYVVGENNFSLVYGDNYRKDITFFITTEGARALTPIYEKEAKDGDSEILRINFKSSGRSNQQNKSARSEWLSDSAVELSPGVPYKAEFHNFNWYNNGWLDDSDGMGSYMSISNGSSLRIPMQEIDLNTGSYDWTFEIRFRIRNAKEYGTLVTSTPLYRWRNIQDGSESATGQELKREEIEANPDLEMIYDDDNYPEMNEENPVLKEIRTDNFIPFKYLYSRNNNYYGFALGTQEAYFILDGKIVNVQYKENEIINISFVIQNKQKLLVYLNGILSGAIPLDKAGSVTIPQSYFEITSDYCDFDLYNLRVYAEDLSMPEVIHNVIADTKNVKIYDENQLTEDSQSTEISYHKLINYNNTHPDNLTMPYVVIDMTNSIGGSELPHVKDAAGRDNTRIEFTNPWADKLLNSDDPKEKISEWEYYTHCPSYTANNVNINVQGTSSQKYPRRNFKTKFKKAKQWVYTAGPLAGLPVNLEYYFDENGNVDTENLELAVSLQDRINELKGLKNPSQEETDELNAKKNELKVLKTGKRVLSKNWHEDSEDFGSNKFTWKIDFMESSGSYNTGFANLIGNFYESHPLQHIGVITEEEAKKYRTSVYGFPMITFHKVGDNYKYIGRYNYNLDKSSNERYGFELEKEHPYVVNQDGTHPLIANVAECWELRDNQGTYCSFRYPDAATRAIGFQAMQEGSTDVLEALKHFEARYHIDADPFEWAQKKVLDQDTTGLDDFSSVMGTDKRTQSLNCYNRMTNFEKVFNWLDSCDNLSQNVSWELLTDLEIDGLDNEGRKKYRVSNVITDEAEKLRQGVEYTVENVVNESGQISIVNFGYFTKDSTEYRRQKFYNEFEDHFNLEYCLIYFVMTELLLCYDSRGKNMMLASFGPQKENGEYIWYPIFYDIDTQLGLNNVGAKLWDYYQDCSEKGTFSTASSILWTNFFDLFNEQIKEKYRTLRARSEKALDYDTIEGSYMCDPNIYDSYAMKGCRPLVVLGYDLYYKYVLPLIEEWKTQQGSYITSDYLYVCQGDRKLSRELLINNRLSYMDSKWKAKTYTIARNIEGINFRVNGNRSDKTSDKYMDVQNPSQEYVEGETQLFFGDLTFTYMPYKKGIAQNLDSDPNYKIKSFLKLYNTIFTDQNTYVADQPYDTDLFPDGQEINVTLEVSNSFKYNTVDQQLNYVAGAENIVSVGDLSTKYVSEISFVNAVKLKDLIIGSDAPDFYNREVLFPFLLCAEKDYTTNKPKSGHNKPLLEKIILTNMKGLGLTNDKGDKVDTITVDAAPKLAEFRALGTSINKVIFADGAVLHTVHLPNTINELNFIQNKNLTRILTAEPKICDYADKENQNFDLVYYDPESYRGLYIEGLTDYTPIYDEFGKFIVGQQGSTNINQITFEGVNLGYDSYIILRNLVYKKYGIPSASLGVKMTELEWTPYEQVQFGEGKTENPERYFLLTEHNTYIPYPISRDTWNDDTLNGLVYLKNLDKWEQKNTITDLEILNIFLTDNATQTYQFTNTTAPRTLPALTGEIFVYNTEEDPIDEAELSKNGKYGRAWPNLKITAQYVNEAYLVRYMERSESGKDSEIQTFRYVKGENVHPECIENLSKQDYVFLGWSKIPYNHALTEEEVNAAINAGTLYQKEQIENLVFSSENDTYTFYACWKYASYVFNFYSDEGVLAYQESVVWRDHVIEPTIVPLSLREGNLSDDERYRFVGWVEDPNDMYPESLDLITLVDVTKYISRVQNNGKNFYACYVIENCLDNLTDLKYFNFVSTTFNHKGYHETGYKLSLKEEYRDLGGKITLPTRHPDDQTKIIAIADFGVFNDNANLASKITHVYFQGEPCLLQINERCFQSCLNLKMFDIPETVRVIYAGAFLNCQELKGIDLRKCTNLDTVDESAFNSAFASNIPIHIHIPSSVTYIGNFGFGYFSGYQGSVNPTLQIGEPGNPSQLTSVGGNEVFKQNTWRPYSAVTIYYDPTSQFIKNDLSFTQLFSLTPGAKIEFKEVN